MRRGLLLLGCCVVSVVRAEPGIVADMSAPSIQQPDIFETRQGVPQIDIQTPSPAGVSRNTYVQFDIEQRGAILNNSAINTHTQLSGEIAGNPHLSGGSARVILNEVNSSKASELRGMLEVAGSRADVVIANPSGIICNGCGVINAHQMTYTTGRPQFDEVGHIRGYGVKEGLVDVGEQGIDARDSDYTTIISRAVEINGVIHAKDIYAKIGATEDAIGPAPKVAIDVKSLGGMYANEIFLVGTEAGVGVRNAGEIGAGPGGFVITVDGRIENKGSIQSAGEAVVAARDIYNADGAVLDSKKQMILSGPLDELGHITGRAERVLNESGDIKSGERLKISAEVLENRDIHFETKVVSLPTETGVRYYVEGDSTAYDKMPAHFLPGRARTQRAFAKHVTETAIAESKPAKFLSDGEMWFDLGRLVNDKGQVVSAGPMMGSIGSLASTEVKGERVEHSNLNTFTIDRNEKRRHWDPEDYVAKTTFTLPTSYISSNGKVVGPALISSGGASHLTVAGDVHNQGTWVVDELTLRANGILNESGVMDGRRLDLSVAEDFKVLGGQLTGGELLKVFAGRDVLVSSQLSTSTYATGQTTNLADVASLSVGNGSLQLEAGRDAIFKGAQVMQAGAGTLDVKGRDICLETLQISNDQSLDYEDGHTRSAHYAEDIGNAFSSEGDANFKAEGAFLLKASSIDSDNDLNITAKTAQVVSGKVVSSFDEHRETQHRNLFNKTKTKTDEQGYGSDAIQSELGAKRIRMDIAEDARFEGAKVHAEERIQVKAENLYVGTTQNEYEYRKSVQSQESGVMGTGRGVMVGEERINDNYERAITTQVGSTFTTDNGNIDFLVNNHYSQEGSHLSAPNGTTRIEAASESIISATDSDRELHHHQVRRSGVMLGATSPAYDAARSMDESFKNLKTVDNDGLKVLAGMNIATQVANLNEMAQGIQTAWKTDGEMPLDSVVKGTANIGVQMFEDWREVGITKAVLPVIETHRFELVLQGKGKDSDAVMTGVQLKAKEADFDIEGDLHLNAATNERTEVALHRSEMVSLGASVGLQGKVSITGQGSQQRTDVNSVDLTHTSTHFDIGAFNLKAGGDVTLNGALVDAKHLQAKIGGDLEVTSLQDRSTYTSQDKQLQFSFSIPIEAGVAKANAAKNQNTLDYHQNTVTEQSGFQIGEEGSHVEVQGHTIFTGAIFDVALSAISAGLHYFSTGTLSTQDIQNEASAHASAKGFSLSEDMVTQGAYGTTKALAKNTLLNANLSESDQSLTRTALSEGEYYITNEAEQLGVRAKPQSKLLRT
ncbi:MAG: hemagglutinin repeat-containing protein [Gammaproteobacteria bacterium]